MKRISLTLSLLLTVLFGRGQAVNFTPNASTIIITTNTTVGIGGGNFKTYLVCPGVTLSYAESSTMDTILLEAGSTIKFDSAISYGYATVYAKNGSTVDMNFRQTGKLIYEIGASILDTNVGPPSFFMGKQLASPLTFFYSNLPGGAGCTPNGVADIQMNHFLKFMVQGNELQLLMKKESLPSRVKIVNSFGQILLNKQIFNERESMDISSLSSGLYYIVWNTDCNYGNGVFIK